MSKTRTLAQKELCQKIGVSELTAFHYEADKQNLTIETLTKMANNLDLKSSPGELV